MNKQSIPENKSRTIMDQLRDPFHQDDIEWRVQSSGINQNNQPFALVIPYVQSRAVQQRFDDLFGLNWQNEYKEGPQGGVLCGISVKHEDEWITRWDGAENTKIESVKGGLSDSTKRAAVQFGVGRYLYKLDAVFAVCSTGRDYANNITFQKMEWNNNTRKKEKVGDPIFGSWDIPQLPAWAIPKEFIKLKQVRSIQKILEETGIDLDYFYEWLNISSIGRIKNDDYEHIMEKLEQKKQSSTLDYAMDMAVNISLLETSSNINMLKAVFNDIQRKANDDKDTLIYTSKIFEKMKKELSK